MPYLKKLKTRMNEVENVKYMGAALALLQKMAACIFVMAVSRLNLTL